MSTYDIFSGLTISASGMRAQRIRQNTISSNLANIETTRTEQGGPYKRQFAVFTANPQYNGIQLNQKPQSLKGIETNCNHFSIPSKTYVNDMQLYNAGVSVSEIREDSRPPQLKYEPSHPDADSDGYVALPNVNIMQEMTDMISATRAYEANVTAFNAIKSMISQALQM